MDETFMWKPHGHAFFVPNHEKCVENVLSFTYEMTSFPSFTRQLNLWGFKRITQGKDAGAYYHELFL